MTAALELLLLSLVWGAGVAASQARPSKGPPQRRREVETVLAGRGEDVKLVCPVFGSPPPLIEWSKDGEAVDYSWTRVKTNKNYLRLRSAQPGDTVLSHYYCAVCKGMLLQGVWRCRAVNGFGHTTVRVELVVTEGGTELGQPDPLPVAAPVFTRETLELQGTSRKKQPGESIVLECEALGRSVVLIALSPEVYLDQ